MLRYKDDRYNMQHTDEILYLVQIEIDWMMSEKEKKISF
jgi:hypothetical protein